VARQRLADGDASPLDVEQVDGGAGVRADLVDGGVGGVDRGTVAVGRLDADAVGRLGVDDHARFAEPDAERPVQPLVREAEVTEAEVESGAGARACHGCLRFGTD